MEECAQKFAEQISLQLGFDQDKKEIIAYGLIALLQALALLLIISFFGFMCGFFYESLLIFFSVGLLKKSTGGAHSETMFGCMIVSVLSIVLLSVFSRYVLSIAINPYLNVAFSIVVFVICLVVFIRRVPVDSPNKPINRPEKIRRLRIQSFIILTVYTSLSVLFIIISRYNERFLALSVALRLALLWQTLMLTKIGIKFFKKFDTKFVKKEV